MLLVTCLLLARPTTEIKFYENNKSWHKRRKKMYNKKVRELCDKDWEADKIASSLSYLLHPQEKSTVGYFLVLMKPNI